MSSTSYKNDHETDRQFPRVFWFLSDFESERVSHVNGFFVVVVAVVVVVVFFLSDLFVSSGLFYNYLGDSKLVLCDI